jgi:hypothetical protein
MVAKRLRRGMIALAIALSLLFGGAQANTTQVADNGVTTTVVADGGSGSNPPGHGG